MTKDVFLLTFFIGGVCDVTHYKSVDDALEALREGDESPVGNFIYAVYLERMEQLGREDDDFDKGVYAEVEEQLFAEKEELLLQAIFAARLWRGTRYLSYASVCFGMEAAKAKRDILLAGEKGRLNDNPKIPVICRKLGELLAELLDDDGLERIFCCVGEVAEEAKGTTIIMDIPVDKFLALFTDDFIKAQ